MPKRKAYTTKLNSDLMAEIKTLAQQKSLHQNDLIEEAIQDVLKKYNGQNKIRPSIAGVFLLQTLPNNIG
jgi:metal-responsive CopG/Arc/MetJ family transcriptional regulator